MKVLITGGSVWLVMVLNQEKIITNINLFFYHQNIVIKKY